MVGGMRKLVIALIVALTTCLSCSAATASPPVATPEVPQGVVPLFGDVVRPFDPPDQPWLAGHRGVDIAGSFSQPVMASLPGVVSFTGPVAGRPVITVRHGELSTTYEPVEASVGVGQPVEAGEVIGYLTTGHDCPADACLHWGLRHGDSYLDPLRLVSTGPLRLIAAADMEAVRSRAAEFVQTGQASGISAAGLTSPAAGPISSPYGMRLHPIDGVWRFHDGVDIAASCGAPIIAVAAGTVTDSGYSPGHGNRLVINHDPVGSHSLTTSYSHAQAFSVTPGARIAQGQVVGIIGSTGASTGCHVHFQAWLDGELTDPLLLLP